MYSCKVSAWPCYKVQNLAYVEHVKMLTAFVNHGKEQTYAYLVCRSVFPSSDVSQAITRPDTPHCSSKVLSCTLSLPCSLKGGGKLISDNKSQYFQGIWAPVTYTNPPLPPPSTYITLSLLCFSTTLSSTACTSRLSALPEFASTFVFFIKQWCLFITLS